MMTAQFQLKQQAYSSGLKSRALSILIYLIDRSNKELTCFPAIPTMAEQLHISISTVKRALHELVNCGFIKKDPRFREKNRGQTSNLYTLVMRENDELEASTAAESSDNATSVSTVEKKSVTEKAGQQKAHVVTRISFADIAGQNIAQDEESVADIEPVQEAKHPYTQVCTKQPTKSFSVHFPRLRMLYYQGSSMIHCFRQLFVRRVRKENEAQNNWTGAGVNLQPP